MPLLIPWRETGNRARARNRSRGSDPEAKRRFVVASDCGVP